MTAKEKASKWQKPLGKYNVFRKGQYSLFIFTNEVFNGKYSNADLKQLSSEAEFILSIWLFEKWTVLQN